VLLSDCRSDRLTSDQRVTIAPEAEPDLGEPYSPVGGRYWPKDFISISFRMGPTADGAELGMLHSVLH
jgi:hypothetical protein